MAYILHPTTDSGELSCGITANPFAAMKSRIRFTGEV